MKKKRTKVRRDPNGCFNCGRTDLVPAIDNHGVSYMGCPSCRIVLPPATPTRTEALSLFPAHDRANRECACQLCLALEGNAARLGVKPRAEAEQAVLDAMARADIEELAALVDGEVPDTPLWEIAACRAELTRRGLKP